MLELSEHNTFLLDAFHPLAVQRQLSCSDCLAWLEAKHYALRFASLISSLTCTMYIHNVEIEFLAAKQH
jgi:hypothetical protein